MSTCNVWHIKVHRIHGDLCFMEYTVVYLKINPTHKKLSVFIEVNIGWAGSRYLSCKKNLSWLSLIQINSKLMYETIKYSKNLLLLVQYSSND